LLHPERAPIMKNKFSARKKSGAGIFVGLVRHCAFIFFVKYNILGIFTVPF
jgi:hypothetical protein